MLNSIITAITKAVNAYIKLDPESSIRLKKLHGKLICIELLPFEYVFYCAFLESGVNITTTSTLNPDATIKGTPWQMLNVMVNKKDRQHFFAKDIEIAGDVEIANQVIRLFDDLQIDIEDELSQYIGDTPAYHINNFIKNTQNWFRSTLQSFTNDVNEYTHEEANWFPPSEAVSDFFNEIDELRMDVDRISQRFEKVKDKIDKTLHTKKKTGQDDEGAQ